MTQPASSSSTCRTRAASRRRLAGLQGESRYRRRRRPRAHRVCCVRARCATCMQTGPDRHRCPRCTARCSRLGSIVSRSSNRSSAGRRHLVHFIDPPSGMHHRSRSLKARSRAPSLEAVESAPSFQQPSSRRQVLPARRCPHRRGGRPVAQPELEAIVGRDLLQVSPIRSGLRSSRPRRTRPAVAGRLRQAWWPPERLSSRRTSNRLLQAYSQGRPQRRPCVRSIALSSRCLLRAHRQ